ncbi:hypothetical protein [Vreelandella titanicae]|uniref:Uncharacterized protein n=1 Tax=Vreelandella titanicae TaxID=664683 RepID=A0AAP9NMN5_9GAMM|nr:hypothetical protein [Halomonas titanicae]QKS24616.1 hypothetical protein FX987_02398 [Halomonas titanicae]
MGIKILAGHMYYGKASQVIYIARKNRIDFCGGLFKCDKVKIEDVESIEEAGEDDVKRIGAAMGWGAAGAVLLGPLGLLAGALFGGKGKDTVFIITLKNGYVSMCQGPTKEFTELKAAMMQHALKAST